MRTCTSASVVLRCPHLQLCLKDPQPYLPRQNSYLLPDEKSSRVRECIQKQIFSIAFNQFSFVFPSPSLQRHLEPPIRRAFEGLSFNCGSPLLPLQCQVSAYSGLVGQQPSVHLFFSFQNFVISSFSHYLEGLNAFNKIPVNPVKGSGQPSFGVERRD